MVGVIILIAVCLALMVFCIPVCAVLGAFVAALFDDDWAPLGGVIGWILGIAVWIVALVGLILNIINLIQILS